MILSGKDYLFVSGQLSQPGVAAVNLLVMLKGIRAKGFRMLKDKLGEVLRVEEGISAKEAWKGTVSAGLNG
jgi:hypothetical protein